MNRRQFGLRSLLLLTLCSACCAGVTTRIIAARKSARQQLGLGIQTDPVHWPYDLRNLVKNDEKLTEGLTPCGLAAGFDRSSVWRLQPNAPMIEFLKQHAGLVTTNHLHPRASRLITQTPSEWPKLNWVRSSWFATPGFGTQHIECVDLFLLVIESDTGNALVLHENHF
jgi:hypothetical protein